MEGNSLTESHKGKLEEKAWGMSSETGRAGSPYAHSRDKVPRPGLCEPKRSGRLGREMCDRPRTNSWE